MRETNSDWRQCPPGELDRLEGRLKSARRHQQWGYALSVFGLTAIIVFCTWQVASALLPSFSGLAANSSECAPHVPPVPGAPPNPDQLLEPGKIERCLPPPQLQ